MSDSPSIVDMYRQMEDERVALVAWLREQHADYKRYWKRQWKSGGSSSGYFEGGTEAYRRVLERLGEKP